MITYDELVLDNNFMTVKRAGVEIDLTRREYELLKFFMINPERILTREHILQEVWMFKPDISSRVVDVYVGYLRKKINMKFKYPLLHSRRSYGYILSNLTIKDRKEILKNTIKFCKCGEEFCCVACDKTISQVYPNHFT